MKKIQLTLFSERNESENKAIIRFNVDQIVAYYEIWNEASQLTRIIMSTREFIVMESVNDVDMLIEKSETEDNSLRIKSFEKMSRQMLGSFL